MILYFTLIFHILSSRLVLPFYVVPNSNHFKFQSTILTDLPTKLTISTPVTTKARKIKKVPIVTSLKTTPNQKRIKNIRPRLNVNSNVTKKIFGPNLLQNPLKIKRAFSNVPLKRHSTNTTNTMLFHDSKKNRYTSDLYKREISKRKNAIQVKDTLLTTKVTQHKVMEYPTKSIFKKKQVNKAINRPNLKPNKLKLTSKETKNKYTKPKRLKEWYESSLISQPKWRETKRRKKKVEKKRKEKSHNEKILRLERKPLLLTDLAKKLGEKPLVIMKYLLTKVGMLTSLTQTLEYDICVQVAESFGKVIGDIIKPSDKIKSININMELPTTTVDNKQKIAKPQPRPPVVTIMGHIDHGKTSLLDALRMSQITSTEHGGITQHIGIYPLTYQNQTLTLLDTPGHSAFISMRKRGASVTDLVVLVIAADEGIQPQTIESLVCAQQAKVPILICLTKVDKGREKVEMIKSELVEYNILIEEYGGTVLCAEVSAKLNMNLEDLLEKIFLQVELQELTADPIAHATGTILEVQIQQGYGSVATTIIRNGTLKVGDAFVAGSTSGCVKALIVPQSKEKVLSAPPSTAIQVIGCHSVPNVGDALHVCDTTLLAQKLATHLGRVTQDKKIKLYQQSLLSSQMKQVHATKEQKKMFVILKTDIQSSAEAIEQALYAIQRDNDHVQVCLQLLTSEAGYVTKSDVALASVTKGTKIIAYNTVVTGEAIKMARQYSISIEYYSVVYDVLSAVETQLKEILSPTPDGEFIGQALVQEIFTIGRLGNIAGCLCQEGYLQINCNVRVLRGTKIICQSKRLTSLRKFKEEVEKIEEGSECGLGLEDFEEFSVGDVIEGYM